jgi:hypothetical protein
MLNEPENVPAPSTVVSVVPDNGTTSLSVGFAASAPVSGSGASPATTIVMQSRAAKVLMLTPFFLQTGLRGTRSTLSSA